MGDTLTCKSFPIQVILCCYSTAYIRSIGKHVIELLGLQSLQTRAIKLGKVTDCCMAPRPTLCMASRPTLPRVRDDSLGSMFVLLLAH